jgi:hypothetical protein
VGSTRLFNLADASSSNAICGRYRHLSMVSIKFWSADPHVCSGKAMMVHVKRWNVTVDLRHRRAALAAIPDSR